MLQGAQQFAGDCQALQECFRRWTPRPGAHFRELAEACGLLNLEHAAAAELSSQLQSQPADDHTTCPPLAAIQVQMHASTALLELMHCRVQ